MEQFVLAIQWKKNEAKASKLFFEETSLPSLIEKLGNRRQWISQRGTPDISKYK
jgi:hypothetical protein